MQEKFSITNRASRPIQIGSVTIGGSSPIAVQSMCATRTTDVSKTLEQIYLLESAGADFIRVAVDSQKDVQALESLRKETKSNLVVDLQENYRLAKDVAPYVQKIRYNPGHLHRHQRNLPIRDKVKFLVDVAGENDCALRIGVNFGSLDPNLNAVRDDQITRAIYSALEHCDMCEDMGFTRYLVSLKSSDPKAVVHVNNIFFSKRPEVPLHLGVTEAGLLPDGELKTRMAFEKLLSVGIGDTVRVSLTLPDAEKDKEVYIAREIIEDVQQGRFGTKPSVKSNVLNVISCPSCSRVENSSFVELAARVKEATKFAKDKPITIAVMGCRVNGPGETDDADLGLWCGPNYVNLKVGPEPVGRYSYEDVVGRLLEQMDIILDTQDSA